MPIGLLKIIKANLFGGFQSWKLVNFPGDTLARFFYKPTRGHPSKLCDLNFNSYGNDRLFWKGRECEAGGQAEAVAVKAVAIILINLMQCVKKINDNFTFFCLFGI